MPRQAWQYVTTFPDGTTYTRTTTENYTHTIIGRDSLGWFVWRHYTNAAMARADYRHLKRSTNRDRYDWQLKGSANRDRYDWQLIPVTEE